MTPGRFEGRPEGYFVVKGLLAIPYLNVGLGSELTIHMAK